MNFINTTQTYGRPMTSVNVRRQFGPKDIFVLPGGVALWKDSGRIGVGIFAVVLLITLGFSALISRVDTVIAEQETVHQELMAKKEALDGYKNELWSKENIARLAGKKLALQLPVDGQIKFL